jgi:hypothetical protein
VTQPFFVLATNRHPKPLLATSVFAIDCMAKRIISIALLPLFGPSSLSRWFFVLVTFSVRKPFGEAQAMFSLGQLHGLFSRLLVVFARDPIPTPLGPSVAHL